MGKVTSSWIVQNACFGNEEYWPASDYEALQAERDLAIKEIGRIGRELGTTQAELASAIDAQKLLELELHQARKEIERLRKAHNAVTDLIENSAGVFGLHLNGDGAPWETLQTGGQFEEWLIDFDKAALREVDDVL